MNRLGYKLSRFEIGDPEKDAISLIIRVWGLTPEDAVNGANEALRDAKRFVVAKIGESTEGVEPADVRFAPLVTIKQILSVVDD